jgi:hypothetical protein
MKSDIIKYGYFNHIYYNIYDCFLTIKYQDSLWKIKNGYSYNNKKDILFIGEKIKIEGWDNISVYDVNMYVVDILESNNNIEDDFVVMLVSENNKLFDFSELNYMIKDNDAIKYKLNLLTNVPKDGCFIATYMQGQKFGLICESNKVSFDGVFGDLMLPKFFNLPIEVKERIRIYKKFFKSNLMRYNIPDSIERILR